MDQKVETFDSVDRWIHAMLDRGQVDEHLGWPEGKFPARTLYDSYLVEAEVSGARRRTAEMLVSRRIQGIFGKVSAGKVDSNGHRVNAVRLPPLIEARESFSRQVGEVGWTDDEGALE